MAEVALHGDCISSLYSVVLRSSTSTLLQIGVLPSGFSLEAAKVLKCGRLRQFATLAMTS